jgi:hypothetical protein
VALARGLSKSVPRPAPAPALSLPGRCRLVALVRGAARTARSSHRVPYTSLTLTLSLVRLSSCARRVQPGLQRCQHHLWFGRCMQVRAGLHRFAGLMHAGCGVCKQPVSQRCSFSLALFLSVRGVRTVITHCSSITFWFRWHLCVPRQLLHVPMCVAVCGAVLQYSAVLAQPVPRSNAAFLFPFGLSVSHLSVMSCVCRLHVQSERQHLPVQLSGGRRLSQLHRCSEYVTDAAASSLIAFR